MTDIKTYQFDDSSDDLRRNPYSVKEAYFDELEANLLILSEEDPHLDISQNTPFHVKPDFFDSLESQLLSIPNESSSNTLIWYLTIAASITLFLGLGSFFGSQEDLSVNAPNNVALNINNGYNAVLLSFDSIDDDELLAYASSNLENELSVDDMTDLMDEEMISDLDFATEEHDNLVIENTTEKVLIDLNVDQESLEDYLDEYYDTEDLIETY